MMIYFILSFVVAILMAVGRQDTAVAILAAGVMAGAYDAKEAHSHAHDIACALGIEEARPFCSGIWD